MPRQSPWFLELCKSVRLGWESASEPQVEMKWEIYIPPLNGFLFTLVVDSISIQGEEWLALDHLNLK